MFQFHILLFRLHDDGDGGDDVHVHVLHAHGDDDVIHLCNVLHLRDEFHLHLLH